MRYPVLPEEWKHIRRILAMRLDNVGDVVMLGPALRTLKQALPEATITLMASPAGAQVAEMLPGVDDVLTQRVVWQDISGGPAFDREREWALVEEIRKHHFDAALVFTSFSQSPYPPAYVCCLAGVPLRVGQSKEFGGGLLTQWVKPLPDSVHQVDRNLHLLESCGFTVGSRQLELDIPASAQATADQLLGEIRLAENELFILLAPGASAQARRYDPDRYARVAHLLSVWTRLPIVIVGSAREKALADQVAAAGASPHAVSLAGKTSVAEMAGIVRRASLVIANNSAPMHIADALDRPMVILFSGTEYESQWQPRRAPARLLRRDTDCAPCYAFCCPYNMECLDIPPEQVAASAVQMLEEVGHRRKTTDSLARAA